jgi:hypothetical protein
MRASFSPLLAVVTILPLSAARSQSKPAVQGLIDGQLAAFARAGAEAAYDFAAPDIRERYGNPSNFSP